jgi:flagellar biosynthesis protein FlhA
MANENISILKRIAGFDVLIPIGILFILVIMILPVPAMLLDILLTISITLSVIIMLVSLYILEPLQFSTFPSVLLIVTLYRLALNVATTRRILLFGSEGEYAAGEVIRAFGQFVVGGNYAVGLIIFLILVIINFVVITKGSTRIAEVAARFTLDAMPGKQMSIDADLNAGLIDDQEARRKRQDIQRQADFYGAMDGASKFVRGDAIAGLLITAINILGGLIIGVVQYDMSMGEAAKIFTILTVGDGLVAQIPALIVSTSAGIIITRAAETTDLSEQLVNQLFKNVRVLMLSGGILLFLALVPGLPKLSFIILSAIMFSLAAVSRRSKIRELAEEQEEAVKPPEENVMDLLEVDQMELEIGFNLIPLVDPSKGGTLLERIKSLRKQIALDMGFIVPPIRIRDNLQIGQNEYLILIKGSKVALGEIFPDKLLAMNPEGKLDKVEGIITKEPTFGLEAKWIDKSMRERGEMEGYTIVDPETVIITHLSEVIKNNAHELLGRQEVQELIDKVREKNPKLVDDLIPNVLDLGTVLMVLQNLLKERVSIRNLKYILEILAAYGVKHKRVDDLVERVRASLKRQITESLIGADNKLYIFTLPSKVEQFIAENIQDTDEGKEVVMDPQSAQKILKSIMQKVDEIVSKGISPVLVVSPPIRLPIRRFIERFIPNLNVISHNEISENVAIESMGTLEINL